MRNLCYLKGRSTNEIEFNDTFWAEINIDRIPKKPGYIMKGDKMKWTNGKLGKPMIHPTLYIVQQKLDISDEENRNFDQ